MTIPPELDEEARKVWKKLAPILTRIDLLTKADRDAFALLCQIRARLTEIMWFIKKSNASLVQTKVTFDSTGQEHIELKPSPYVAMEKQYMQLYRLYAGDFGMNPRGRAGLSMGSGKGRKDVLEDLLD